jgi:phosphoesterase RecJ-like protein
MHLSKKIKTRLAKNIEFQEFRLILKQSKRIVVSTHRLPDGDGLGTEAALYHYLRRSKKTCRIYNPDPVPRRYQFLDPKNLFLNGQDSSKIWDSFDLWIIVDTNDPRRLGKVWDELKDRAKKIVFLDHHPDTLTGKGQNKIIYPDHARVVSDTQSSSIGELLFHLFEKLKMCKIDSTVAEGLYVSVMTDTNSFRYARTTPEAHRIAGDMIELGVNPEEVYQNIYSSKEVSHLQFLGTLLQNVQTASNGRIAWIAMDLKTRTQYGASSDDTQSFLNLLLLLRTAEIVCLFREEENGAIRISIKSKGKLIVNHIAMEFGGGGHQYAAGASLNMTLNQAISAVTQRLSDSIK